MRKKKLEKEINKLKKISNTECQVKVYLSINDQHNLKHNSTLSHSESHASR